MSFEARKSGTLGWNAGTRSVPNFIWNAFWNDLGTLGLQVIENKQTKLEFTLERLLKKDT